MPHLIDPLNIDFRRLVITAIMSDENRERKRIAKKRWEIYRDKLDKHIRAKIREDFGAKSEKHMRVISNINLTKRIINAQASVYQEPPNRKFLGASEEQIKQIAEISSTQKTDTKLMKSNRFYKLQQQCAIQIIPKNDILFMKVLSPHQYDVIPNPSDPEAALIYILNTFSDKVLIDGQNKIIADENDIEGVLGRFIWWTPDWHFETNKDGEFVLFAEKDDNGQPIAVLPNPIGRLPFIDVAGDKDDRFFVEWGSSISDFTITFGSIMSDHFTVQKFQGFGQAVVSGGAAPENFQVGPMEVLNLGVDSEGNQAKFEFVSPSPDLEGGLKSIEVALNFFLSSEGLDSGVVSGKGESQRFNSGFERLLAQIEKFTASKEDMDLFQWVEQQVWELNADWLLATTDTENLNEDIRGAIDTDAVTLETTFGKPEFVQSKDEKENSIIKRLNAGLITKLEAIAEDRDIPVEDAATFKADIDAEKMANASRFMGNFNRSDANGEKQTDAESDTDVQPPGDVRPES